MIGALKGTVFSKTQNPILLLTQGVGYLVHVTEGFLESAEPNTETFLFIHSHIRDDTFDLFGFPTRQELVLFELLIGVSGVGPKTALTVINRGVSAVTLAVQKSDVDFFTTIPRLGKKNAQKIIIELKQKLGSSNDLDLSDISTSETKEVLEALLSMGFIKNEILAVIKNIPDDKTTLEQKVRFCLTYLGKKS